MAFPRTPLQSPQLVSPQAIRRSDIGVEVIDPAAIAPPAPTSRRGFLMNTMVSAAAFAPAAAVATPSIVAPACREVSFPGLVKRFMQVRERWSAQREMNQAWSDRIDQQMTAATGLSCEQLREISHDDPRRPEIDAIFKRVCVDDPSDPLDAEGCSIAWTEISDELDSVANAMLRRRPLSATDLAWQAEALMTADSELRDDLNTEHYPMLARLLENIRELAGPSPLLRGGISALTVPVANAVDELWSKRRALIRTARQIYVKTSQDDPSFRTYEAEGHPILKEAWAVGHEFVDLPHSLNKLGALMLCDLEKHCECPLETPNDPSDGLVQSLIAQLTTLEPFLTGIVGQDVRELLENHEGKSVTHELNSPQQTSIPSSRPG
jgi:hypothetical protein